MSKKLRVAILSAWHVHSEEYTLKFGNNEDSEVCALWDDDVKRGEEFAKKHGLEFEPNLDKLLARTDIDAVSVTTSTNLHKEVIIKAANAKKHIFTEKVLAITLKEALEIKEAVVNNGVKFCICFFHRSLAHNVFAKKVIDEKLIGEVTLLRVRNAHNGAIANWLPPHFYDEIVCGGGAMIDLGAHPMYLCNWFMGKAKAVNSTFTSFTNKDVEDNAVSTIEYENGAIAISETGFVSNNSPFILELYGTDGTLFFRSHENKIELISEKLESEIKGWISVSEQPKKPEPVIQFIRGVLFDEVIDYDIDEAVKLTEIMEAAYESHKQSKKIYL